MEALNGYNAVLELELWKKTEREKFQLRLQAKEDALMKMLANEWRTRDKQREIELARKTEEYVVYTRSGLTNKSS